jgi:hypothetical protein
MNSHQVYITDEAGMVSVFPRLKETLAGSPLTAITVLYHSRENFAFCKEFNFLERHFPTRLYISYERLATDSTYILNQEAIEAVINANTIPAIVFIISGSTAFTEESKATIEFLHTGPIIIQEQQFTCL